MKGGVASGGHSGKRRWKGLVIGVLGLVFLSMLVPLLFLLGLHNGFHPPGYVPEQRSSPSIGVYGPRIIINASNMSGGAGSKRVDDLVKKFAPTLSKDILKNISHKAISDQAKNETKNVSAIHNNEQASAVHNNEQAKGYSVPPHDDPQSQPIENNSKAGDSAQIIDYAKGGVDQSGKSCELKFGSYCLWREQHREDMKDAMVKRLKDQLFVARAYFPSIAKLPSQDKLSREMRQNIQEVERVLSESTTDADLPPQIEKKLRRLQASTAKAKTFHVDCNNVDKKLRQIYDMTEDEANFHMRQSVFLYQLAVQTMPKSHHCLSMRLTVEYFRSPFNDTDSSLADKYIDRTLQHYVIFSTNVLASSVVINSTVMHAKDSRKLVFHVLTDQENYFAMKLWFFRNTYKEATVEVLNMEQLNLDNRKLYLSLPLEFFVSYSIDAQSRTEYLSTFSHSHYLLPEIFRNLEKVVVLDDDVVVQQDLSALWSLNMEGKVNAAVQLCSVKLSLLKSVLGKNSFDKNSCAWMSGLNVIDLVKWRELDLTETYKKFVAEVMMQEGVNEAAALHASLLTFRDLIYPLDGSWALSGLGHDYNVDVYQIKKAAVLHYNGKMKPWLELGIPKYKRYWKIFLSREDQFLSDCNVNS
ncbi:galacturonosyltransferase 7 [Pyrus ussuriensis x Pyrus communis]|uniref:Hexosyltransferase n=1 Tax=Pyrus ussuriensis x Pyrus communis TaxID=2448454 RepID=A0A5N5HR96_9ROSA|nr:galacturonosyltransferase 7 [Pyrus ussuriensis x Pyrus communis]